MNREVLRAGGCLPVLPVSLQAFYKRNAQRSRQVGILPVGLLASPPARIPEDIDIRRPEGQSLIDIPVPKRAEGIVLGTPFNGDHIRNLLDQFFVKCRAKGDRLRETGRGACPGNSVQALVPPVIGGDMQPCDLRRIVSELTHLLFHSHS